MDGGTPVTAFDILIADDSGQFISSSECDGTDPTTVSNLYCLVSISTLMGTLGLDQGDLVAAKVTAINVIGSGTQSSANTAGALI